MFIRKTVPHRVKVSSNQKNAFIIFLFLFPDIVQQDFTLFLTGNLRKMIEVHIKKQKSFIRITMLKISISASPNTFRIRNFRKFYLRFIRKPNSFAFNFFQSFIIINHRTVIISIIRIRLIPEPFELLRTVFAINIFCNKI